MRILLDTHTFLWWLEGHPRLSHLADRAIRDRDTEVLVSAATAWEISTKFRIGKLPGVARLAGDLPEAIRGEGFAPLDVTVEDGQRAGALRSDHRDPFDRMLVAQALRLDIPIVSCDAVLDPFGVRRVW